MFEPPCDRHRTLPFVPHICGRSKTPKRAVTLTQTSEENDFAASVSVLLVTKARLTIGTRDRLTLPMNEVTAQRIIPITVCHGATRGPSPWLNPARISSRVYRA